MESPEGKGTTLAVLLPLIHLKGENEVEEIGEPARGEGRILFVDDEKEIVDLGRRMLQHLGYEVVARTSSLEALEAFKANPGQFNLVITDMTMPQMTGDRLAVELLKIRSEVPVILCTGFSERISEDTARKIGVKALVMKPILMRDLAETIKNALEPGD